MLRGGGGFRQSDLLLGVEYLSLQVTFTHRVRIGQADTSYAGSRQVEGGGRAEAPDADDQHRSIQQPALSLLPDLRQHRLPCVAFFHRQSKILSQSFQTTS